MTTLTDQIDKMRNQLNELEARVAEEAEAQQNNPAHSPEVQAASEALARAVAKQFGGELPVQVAPGSSSLPVMELPAEFTKYGGVGVAVIVAPPTEAALEAAGIGSAEWESDEEDEDIPF